MEVAFHAPTQNAYEHHERPETNSYFACLFTGINADLNKHRYRTNIVGQACDDIAGVHATRLGIWVNEPRHLIEQKHREATAINEVKISGEPHSGFIDIVVYDLHEHGDTEKEPLQIPQPK